MTIDGDTYMIYRVESRNKLDGSDWKLHINRAEPLRYLLSQYRDNDFVEYRIKSFKSANEVRS